MKTEVLVKELRAFALSYVKLCRSARIPSLLSRRKYRPMSATLSLLWVEGPTSPVILMIPPGQKHRFMIVQPDPGRVGPLLTER